MRAGLAWSSALRSLLRHTIGEMLIDDLLRRIFASSAANADRQFALDIQQRAGAVLDDFADLTIGHALANANVHSALLSRHH